MVYVIVPFRQELQLFFWYHYGPGGNRAICLTQVVWRKGFTYNCLWLSFPHPENNNTRL